MMVMYEKENIDFPLVAGIKRFLEYWTMEPGFAERFRGDEAGTLRSVGLEELAEAETINSLKLLAYYEEAIKVKDVPLDELPYAAMMYRKFMKAKLDHRQQLKLKGCVPDNKSFAAWRERQVNRCWAELGSRNDAIIHTPIVFELSLGCSVGCPFCGVAAGGLKSVFRGTEENLQLWRELLTVCREVIGPAAGTGTCYYACEPLDNPEYEQFAAAFFEVMGQIPQITTAAAMRRPERIKAALRLFAEKERHIHRFSVLSLDIFHRIMEYFTPEELVDVELLPQFEEAPNCAFAEAGRARELESSKVIKDDKGGDTIACVSGFVVNMAERSLRLITPCASNAVHPTGEMFIARESFKDVADFAVKLKKIISECMLPEFPRDYVLRLRKGMTLEKTDEGIVFYRNNGFKLRFTENDDISAKAYHLVYEYVKEQKYSAYDIAGELMDKGINPAQVFFILKRFSKAGLCLEPYEKADEQ